MQVFKVGLEWPTVRIFGWSRSWAHSVALIGGLMHERDLRKCFLKDLCEILFPWQVAIMTFKAMAADGSFHLTCTGCQGYVESWHILSRRMDTPEILIQQNIAALFSYAVSQGQSVGHASRTWISLESRR